MSWTGVQAATETRSTWRLPSCPLSTLCSMLELGRSEPTLISKTNKHRHSFWIKFGKGSCGNCLVLYLWGWKKSSFYFTVFFYQSNILKIKTLHPNLLLDTIWKVSVSFTVRQWFLNFKPNLDVFCCFSGCWVIVLLHPCTDQWFIDFSEI